MPGTQFQKSFYILKGIFGILILLILLISSCGKSLTTPPNTKQASIVPGNQIFHIQHQGRERSYLIHTPSVKRHKPPFPVVISLHGGGGNAKSHQDYTQMDSIADTEGFVIVYPNGTGRIKNKLLTWNSGSCCGYAYENDIDDVGFIDNIITELTNNEIVSTEKVFVTGMSNGAMMAYKYAAETQKPIAAIATVAGVTFVESIRHDRPVSLMHIHSVDDPRALYTGGIGPPFPMTEIRVHHPPVQEVLIQWLRHNQCKDEFRIGKNIKGKPGSREAGMVATEYVFGACDRHSKVIHWKMRGVGHVWPGGRRNYLVNLLGPTTNIINANHEIWRFFKGVTYR